MAGSDLLALIERRLQDRKALERSRVDPVVNQIIESTVSELSHSPDFKGRVKEQLQPVIVSVIRFLKFCLDAQRGAAHSHTRYLFAPDALEGQLQQHLSEWFYGASGFTDLVIEAQQIAAGRIDMMFTFEGFRFVIELKREQEDARRHGLGAYLRQTSAYQATDITVGMLVVLDLTATPLPDHMRDHVWVDTVPSSEAGGTNRHIAVVRIPGNRTAPSRLSSHIAASLHRDVIGETRRGPDSR